MLFFSRLRVDKDLSPRPTDNKPILLLDDDFAPVSASGRVLKRSFVFQALRDDKKLALVGSENNNVVLQSSAILTVPDHGLRLLLLGKRVLRLHEEVFLLLSELVDLKEIVADEAEQVVLLRVLEDGVDIGHNVLDFDRRDDPGDRFLAHMVIW